MTVTGSILKEGSKGPEVTKLQQNLKTAKLYSGAIDGIFGSQTTAAVKKLQQLYSLTVDGVVGPQTQRELDREIWVVQRPLLKEGSQGAEVKGLQELLNSVSFSVGTVDGIFGPKMKATVIKFQQARKLTADGVVGANTWRSLSILASH